MNIREFLLQNNVVDEIEEGEYLQYEDSNQDMNYFGELLSEGFLTEHNYQNSVFFMQIFIK